MKRTIGILVELGEVLVFVIGIAALIISACIVL